MKNNIHPTAVIYPGVYLGKNTTIGAHCIIGAPAESLKFWGDPPKFTVIIEDDVVLNGLNTIDAGTVQNTIIGKGSFLMKAVHVGHDSTVGENCVLSPHVVVGGHCVIGERCNLGIASVIHQRCEIPKGCMIGMNSTITKKSKLKEFSCYVGSPVKYLRENKTRKR